MTPLEWQQVYRLLYSHDTSSQTKGLAFVRMWSRRGPRLPLAVESTAELLLANHARHSASAVSAYSLAIIRFVNGHVDKAQGGFYARSVARVAAELGIPDWVIDIRHSATHKNLPDIDTLVSATAQMLKWLENSYWKPHDACIDNAKSEMMKFCSAYQTVQTELSNMRKEGKKTNKTKITLIIEQISSMPYYELSLLPSYLCENIKYPQDSIKFEYWKPLIAQLYKTKPSVIAHIVYNLCQKLSSKIQEREDTFSFINSLIQENMFGAACQELHALFVDLILKFKNDDVSRKICCRILNLCGEKVSGRHIALRQLLNILEAQSDHPSDVCENMINEKISNMRCILEQMEVKSVKVDNGSRFKSCDASSWYGVPLGCIPSNISLSMDIPQLRTEVTDKDSGRTGQSDNSSNELPISVKDNLQLNNMEIYEDYSMDVDELKELRDSIRIFGDLD